ncbi:hypothetical protein D3C87_2207040 [compost metagenome]
MAANPLKEAAKFNLFEEDSAGPKIAAYGFALVSKIVKPHPITNRANKNNS